MDNRSSNSRTSSRYSKSVVLPRIKTDERYKDRSDENISGADFDRITSKVRQHSQQHDDLSKYILERLDFTEKAIETERRDRSLLEDHVRGLMLNLQRLSKDMATLQQQLKSGESNANSQGIALRNLELHQVSGIGDIWNRLTLGDLNTIKLSGDLNKLSGEVHDLKRNQEDLQKKLERLTTKVETNSVEFEKNIQVLKVELHSKIANLEKSVHIAEKRNGRLNESNDLKQEVEEHYSNVLENFEERFDQFVEKHEFWKEGVQKQILLIDEDLFQVKEATGINYKELTVRIDDFKTKQKRAMEKCHETLKDNYREAFRAVYESITTMQTVLETKLKMTEADLKTSINSILKTISQ